MSGRWMFCGVRKSGNQHLRWLPILELLPLGLTCRCLTLTFALAVWLSNAYDVYGSSWMSLNLCVLSSNFLIHSHPKRLKRLIHQ
ncbi:hypothetical protein BJ170DRAFT_641107 [Xylariales sp. AK1849]|nr:hypothetical protein BJ170DRAFT_641107 [Xylariales sp. AK1849]